MNKRFATVFGLLAALPLLAQQPPTDTLQSLSLEQAQQMALTNNAKVVNSQLDLEIAKKKIWETTAIGLPQLKGELGYTFNPNPTDLSSMAGQAPGSIFDYKHKGSYTITVSQLIFSGEYIVGLKASKTYKRFADESYESAQIDMKETIANSYYTALVVEENLRLLDSSMVLVKSTVDEMAAMAKVGFVESTDADQMTINYVTLQNQRANLARQALFAQRILKFNVGLPLENELTLSQTLDELFLSANILTIDTGAFTVESQIQARILQTNEDLMKLSYQRTQSTYLPTLAGFYQHKGFNKDPLLPFDPENIAGATLSWNLFTSGQRCSQVQQAKMEYIKATNTKQQGQEGLQLAVIQAESDYINALNVYSAENEKLALAQRIFTNYLVKQKNGMAKSMDVTTAQNQYIQSQTAYFTAVFDVLRLKTALDKAKGTL